MPTRRTFLMLLGYELAKYSHFLIKFLIDSIDINTILISKDLIITKEIEIEAVIKTADFIMVIIKIIRVRNTIKAKKINNVSFTTKMNLAESVTKNCLIRETVGTQITKKVPKIK